MTKISSTVPRFYTQYTPTGYQPGEPITLSTLLILEAAEKLGVQYQVLPGTKIIKLSYNGQDRYFRFQISSETTDIGFYACLDKNVTNNLLRAARIQVPHGYYLTRNDSREYQEVIFNSLSKPLVVKPTFGQQGNSVSLGIQTLEEYSYAIDKAFAFNNDQEAGVLVEETCQGKEHRILVTRDKVLGILYRMPANVIGDGQHTIEELIDQKNADPRRGTDSTYALYKIIIDEDLLFMLNTQDLTLTSVPEAGKRIFVRRVSNIAKGGDSIDVTDTVHQSVKELALKAINAIPGVNFAGIDFMTTNIEVEQTPDMYTIIEINSSPGFCVQEFPFLGKPRNAQYEFLYLSFPELRQ